MSNIKQRRRRQREEAQKHIDASLGHAVEEKTGFRKISEVLRNLPEVTEEPKTETAPVIEVENINEQNSKNGTTEITEDRTEKSGPETGSEENGSQKAGSKKSGTKGTGKKRRTGKK